VAAEALRLLDIRLHEGVHPRLGVVDVVPFVSLGALDDNPIGEAPALPGVTDDFAGEVLTARDSFARWFAGEGVPCFFYGPERSLPEVRRHAFGDLPPDLGPPTPHLSAGACCVGARPILIAYNLVLAAGATLADGKGIAAELRRKELRTLGLATGDEVQVSCNLVAPDVVGPAEAYDAVAARAAVARAELVGLLPRRVLHRIDRDRWTQLDLDGSKTIESRLARQQAR
ncbi:MAG: hypothetical protein ACRDZ5_04570, partial [Acidimicrobiales bacterium]